MVPAKFSQVYKLFFIEDTVVSCGIWCRDNLIGNKIIEIKSSNSIQTLMVLTKFLQLYKLFFLKLQLFFVALDVKTIDWKWNRRLSPSLWWFKHNFFNSISYFHRSHSCSTWNLMSRQFGWKWNGMDEIKVQ